MEQYKVTGMSCAACVARVEKAVQSVPGVDSVAVSLLTNSMSVEVVALTKSDKLNKTQYREALAERSSEIAQYGAVAIIPFSAKTGEGAETIRQFIADSVKYVS